MNKIDTISIAGANPADVKQEAFAPMFERFALPVFVTLAEERRHRKERLAAAFCIFANFGFCEGVAGHITPGDPEFPDTFWVNPFGMHFGQIKVSDLIRVDNEGNVVEATRPVKVAADAARFSSSPSRCAHRSRSTRKTPARPAP
jgi:hypothetical protein